jgi:hypothetical protein
MYAAQFFSIFHCLTTLKYLPFLGFKLWQLHHICRWRDSESTATSPRCASRWDAARPRHQAPLLDVLGGRTWPFNADATMARRGTTLPGAALADPKQQQHPRLSEMEDLLHGVCDDLARRPSGEQLLRCSVQGLGFANLPG